MKRLLAFLLLSGCGSEQAADVQEEPEAVPPPLPDIGNNIAVDMEALQGRVDEAMRAVLQDAKGARYRNLRLGVADTICGEVDPRKKGGGHSGFRPFLVTPDGVAFLASGPRLTFNDPADNFPDLYIRWCASEEELKRLGPQLDRSIAIEAGPDGALGNLEAIPPPEIEPAPAPQQPLAPPGERKGTGDSFFDAVRKPREPAKTGR